MRSSRFMLLAVMLLGFSSLMPAFGLGGGDREDPRGVPGARQPGIKYVHFKRHQLGNPMQEKILCDFTCANGSGGVTPMETVADCFAYCKGYSGNPCDWAKK